MLSTLLEFAFKSLLIAGISLVLLRLTRHRSAAERSLIAHVGLLALVALPIANGVLPAVHLPLPRIVEAATPLTMARSAGSALTTHSPDSAIPDPNPATPPSPGIDWTPFAYGAPAVALLVLTLLALLRLFVLSRRAEVLVEPVWLSALAHAQRRMGLKNGTALLVSDALPSPVSWGWARPVILLNRAALTETADAEAIIAHELAHVVSLDWAKLMLARVATALFWFNPLAWVLASAAHQLREEAADDAVLATAIAGPDYAQLLVGVARHEARGLLLGAHGVAPSRDSLRRRVGRVLDTTLARERAGPAWMTGFGMGMLVMAAPLAALTVAPRSDTTVAAQTTRRTSLTATTITGETVDVPTDGRTVVRQRDGSTVTILPPDAQGRHPAILRSPTGATVHIADSNAATFPAPPPPPPPPARPEHTNRDPDQVGGPLDTDVAMRATGVTPQYVAQMQAAAPWLGHLTNDDAVALAATGVTPAYVGELTAAGVRPADRDELLGVRAVGVTGAYARSLASAGFRGGVDRLIEMRALGVTAADLRRRRAAGSGSDDDPDPPE